MPSLLASARTSLRRCLVVPLCLSASAVVYLQHYQPVFLCLFLRLSSASTSPTPYLAVPVCLCLPLSAFLCTSLRVSISLQLYLCLSHVSPVSVPHPGSACCSAVSISIRLCLAPPLRPVRPSLPSLILHLSLVYSVFLTSASGGLTIPLARCLVSSELPKLRSLSL